MIIGSVKFTPWLFFRDKGLSGGAKRCWIDIRYILNQPAKANPTRSVAVASKGNRESLIIGE